MSGFQFTHIETFARIPSRSNKKQSARNVAREAERAAGAYPHVENPMPYKLMFGMSPSRAVDLAEKRALVAKDGQGRKLRRDAQVLLGGVASYPVPISQLSPNDEDLKKWLKQNFNFLKLHCGKTLKSICAHTDEKFFHIHWYQVPDIDENGRMNIGQVHPGILARDSIGGKQAKAKMRAYKAAMREFQNNYYEHVGKPCGLTREGAHKRRLSRTEWKAEQAAAERLARSLKTIDYANVQFAALKKEQELITDAKEELLVEKNKLFDLKQAINEEDQQVKKKLNRFLGLKAGKISTVKYLKNQVNQLKNKLSKLIARVSNMKRENQGLKNEVYSLKKRGSELERVNEKLVYQNNVKTKALNQDRLDVLNIIKLASIGRINKINEKYNKNNTKGYI